MAMEAGRLGQPIIVLISIETIFIRLDSLSYSSSTEDSINLKLP